MEINKKEFAVSTIKTLFSAVPFGIGTVLDEVIFEQRSRIKQDRLNKFSDLLQTFFENYGEKPTIENLTSEEFSDIFELVLRKVTETSNVKKLERFKNILVGQMGVQVKHTDFAETFLDLIAKLNDTQILILEEFNNKERIISESQKTRDILKSELKEKREVLEGLILKEDNGTYVNSTVLETSKKEVRELEFELSTEEAKVEKINDYKKARFYNLTESEFEFYTQDLVSKSLMKDVYSTAIGASLANKRITEFGKQFLTFIQGEI